MSRKEQHRDAFESRNRLAQLGLAADQIGPEANCPDDNRFAEMLEAKAGSAEKRAFLEHLSQCEVCLQKWLVISEELRRQPEEQTAAAWFTRRRLLTGVGSACGLALAAMLYLSIDYGSVHYDVADSQLQNTTLSPSADSEPVVEAEKSRQQTMAPMRIEEESTEVASAPSPALRVKKETSGGSIDSLKRDKSVAGADYSDQEAVGPAVNGQSLGSEATQSRSFVAELEAGKQPEYNDFIESIADFCKSDGDEFRPPESAPLLEQGRVILSSEVLPAGESRRFVEDIVIFLEKERTIDDTKWIEFCERARVIMEN